MRPRTHLPRARRSRISWAPIRAPARLASGSLGSPAPVRGAALVVTTTDDTIDITGESCGSLVIGDLPGDGDGKVSLREAICAANNTAGADTITFTLPGVSPWTITLALGQLPITDNLTITGPGGCV